MKAFKYSIDTAVEVAGVSVTRSANRRTPQRGVMLTKGGRYRMLTILQHIWVVSSVHWACNKGIGLNAYRTMRVGSFYNKEQRF